MNWKPIKCPRCGNVDTTLECNVPIQFKIINNKVQLIDEKIIEKIERNLANDNLDTLYCPQCDRYTLL